MKDFNRLLTEPGITISTAEITYLRSVLGKYPWFNTAALLLEKLTGKAEEGFSSSTGVAASVRVPSLEKVSIEDFLSIHEESETVVEFREPPVDIMKVSEKTTSSMISGFNKQSEAIIEKFLAHGDYRVVPDSGDMPEDVAGDDTIGDELSGEIVSEELAEIYTLQGLYAEARECYCKLSLLYPEKSVYFAQIIDGLDRRKEEV